MVVTEQVQKSVNGEALQFFLKRGAVERSLFFGDRSTNHDIAEVQKTERREGAFELRIGQYIRGAIFTPRLPIECSHLSRRDEGDAHRHF